MGGCAIATDSPKSRAETFPAVQIIKPDSFPNFMFVTGKRSRTLAGSLFLPKSSAMHGRLKVKTTAEKAEEKKRERAAKLARYREITGEVTRKRNAAEYDDDFMSFTAEVLMFNPDHATVWNLRRKAILERKETESAEGMADLFEKELKLSEDCLMRQPKSYSSWFQRYWVADNFAEFKWDRELTLTKKALSLDERNFHCWDYRRFLIQHGKVPLDKELAFTDELIERNFSNGSAWHVRSRLLPAVHPGEKHIMSDEALSREIDLVQNAAFTDPDDQAGWIYLPWLVESSRNSKMNRLTSAVVLGNEVFLFFRNPLSKNDPVFVETMSKLNVHFSSIVGYQSLTFSRVWRLSEPSAGVVPNVELIVSRYQAQHPKSFSLSDREGLIVFETPSAAIEEQIQELISSCKQLLELEPKSKWANLIYASLLETTAFREKFDAILEIWEKLPDLDPLRAGFYADMRSKLIFKALASTPELVTKIDLSSRHLTTMYFVPQLLFVRDVDLSNNSLVDTKVLSVLHSVRRLNLEGNSIRTLEGLKGLRQLEELNMADNLIVELSEIETLAELFCLKVLNLKGNPVAQSLDGNPLECLRQSVEVVL